LRDAVKHDREAIAALERREADATGIKSLKIGYNKVFGYYFEVRKADVGLVPDHFLRHQTLVNAERFSTPEVKELESRILGSGEAAGELEKRLYADILLRISEKSNAILEVARKISWLDVFQSLADVASLNGYVRPRLDNGTGLKIQRGRHPVVEVAASGDAYVPNDCCLDEGRRIIVLTGPNMGGKSTMLRMVALIVLMAQMGSFVPADSAEIGLVDRIFSRVGAQDDISAGQSTFMTEMVETANILHHATPRSLLVLDEIGRGTSTYDGLAIARAVIEYIHSRVHARTLFATHYHELTVLEDEFEEVVNFHTSVVEESGAIVFLHQVVPGGSDRSYGIHVARLAGLPHSVTVRAERILRQLERSKNGSRPDLDRRQMVLFKDPDLAPKSEVEQVAIRVLDEILALDLGNTTPLEALARLHEFQEEGRSST
jgi:DNA mismatch repair protein MutS